VLGLGDTEVGLLRLLGKRAGEVFTDRGRDRRVWWEFEVRHPGPHPALAVAASTADRGRWWR